MSFHSFQFVFWWYKGDLRMQSNMFQCMGLHKSEVVQSGQQVITISVISTDTLNKERDGNQVKARLLSPAWPVSKP